jgi:hypothetical protein
LRYRAVAVGLRVNERGVQVYGDDIEVVRDWARKAAEQHGVAVDIMVTEERVLERIGVKEIK